ncbi:hypothetical protein [Legionella sp. km772]|uniref:hypothetical protein n=1 Tax=Legionella sp. km772 TaxID=2498111 RepID=UPI000F8E8242|nr:hypothetical protein [Legionella sp. km772]RUR08401.1 hypothetical protein ELY15_10975 [Legionella sp. km772]
MSSIKHSFFNPATSKANLSFKEDDFDLEQLKNEFGFLSQLFARKDSLLKNYKAISYFYYLANLLSLYYQQDYVREEVEKLTVQRMNIEIFIKEHFDEREHCLIHESSAHIKKALLTSTTLLPSIASFRKTVGFLNSKRSYWGYSRALANHAIFYLQMSFPTSVSLEIIDLLEQSRQPLVNLGIGLYFLRFALHLLMIFKHLFHAALNDELSVKKVLSQELDKRFFTMISDLVWAIVNLLTSYNTIFQIPASIISPLIISILFFDALLFLGQWAFESLKHTRYLEELKRQEKIARSLESEFIKKQIDFFQDQWQVQCAYYLINILAAALIVISFGISLVCSGPLVLAGLALLSSLGNALYNTTDEFKKYQQAMVDLQREKTNSGAHNNTKYQLLNEKYKEACAGFWKYLTLTALGTAFIITLAAISWPVALCLTLSYMAYRLNDNKKSEQKDHGETPSLDGCNSLSVSNGIH